MLTTGSAVAPVASLVTPSIFSTLPVAPVRNDIFKMNDQVLAVPNDHKHTGQIVILDNAATNHVFGSRSLLEGVKK